MAFTEFFNKEAQKEAQKEAYWQNMRKLGQTRHSFLEVLVENGVETTHRWGEVISDNLFDYLKRGRKTTTVKLAAVGEWAEKNNIQVKIFTPVAKDKLRQLQHTNKKPTVHVELTFNNEVVGYFIPNDITSSYAYKREVYGVVTEVGDESFCVGLAEVTEAFQAGKLAEVTEAFQAGKLAVVKE